jgi:hypothetical protein
MAKKGVKTKYLSTNRVAKKIKNCMKTVSFGNSNDILLVLGIYRQITVFANTFLGGKSNRLIFCRQYLGQTKIIFSFFVGNLYILQVSIIGNPSLINFTKNRRKSHALGQKGKGLYAQILGWPDRIFSGSGARFTLQPFGLQDVYEDPVTYGDTTAGNE